VAALKHSALDRLQNGDWEARVAAQVRGSKKGRARCPVLRTSFHSSGDGVTLTVEERKTYPVFDSGEDDRRPRHIHMQACITTSLPHNFDALDKNYSF
jgi:hypothetical protein